MLLGAIKTIHDEGYLHRDISLDNIQIQDNGLPVLLDFGSARRSIGSVSDETETMLRPGYAPIEQYTDDNESEQGPWTDIYALGAVLHTLIVGSPPPVSVVRSIQDGYQPLAHRHLPGYSPSLLQAVDKALALKMEDRPQTIDEFAALIEMPVAGLDDVLNVKKPGTMLVPIEEVETKPGVLDWRRYKVPGLVAAGVLVGLIAGGVLFHQGNAPQENANQTASTGPADTPVAPATPAAPPAQNSAPVSTPPAATSTTAAPARDTASTAPAQTAPVAADKPAATTPPAAIAQVYVRMNEGEKLTLNGESQSITPASNGFATLKLQPGQYALVLQGNGQTRHQTLNITSAGTWLVNPQP